MSKVLEEYARQVRAGLQVKPGTDGPAHCALGLAGEAGEVADLHKKAQYEGRSLVLGHDMRTELGDVLWYLTWLAAEYGTTIEGLAMLNIQKLENRRGSDRYSYARMVEADSANRD